MPNDNEVPLLLEEMVSESKIVQEEILFMLNQVNIPHQPLGNLIELVLKFSLK